MVDILLLLLAFFLNRQMIERNYLSSQNLNLFRGMKMKWDTKFNKTVFQSIREKEL